MSFRVKLRIKRIKTDPELLKALIEAARQDAARKKPSDQYERMLRWPKGGECYPIDDWHRRFGHGNFQYRGPDNSFIWNGIDPINAAVR